jgi:hypothetical protein
MENTSEALRPRALVSEDSEAMVALSGYTPPTPTPRKKRVIVRKAKIDAGSELTGTAKAEARAPRMDIAMVSWSARGLPKQSPM